MSSQVVAHPKLQGIMQGSSIRLLPKVDHLRAVAAIGIVLHHSLWLPIASVSGETEAGGAA